MTASTMRVVPRRSTFISRFLAKRKLLLFFALGVTLVAVGILYVPYRSYNEKQLQLTNVEKTLNEMKAANAATQENIDTLQTDAEVERLARQNFGLVRNGEESYRVLLTPTTIEEANEQTTSTIIQEG